MNWGFRGHNEPLDAKYIVRIPERYKIAGRNSDLRAKLLRKVFNVGRRHRHFYRENPLKTQPLPNMPTEFPSSRSLDFFVRLRRFEPKSANTPELECGPLPLGHRCKYVSGGRRGTTEKSTEHTPIKFPRCQCRYPEECNEKIHCTRCGQCRRACNNANVRGTLDNPLRKRCQCKYSNQCKQKVHCTRCS